MESHSKKVPTKIELINKVMDLRIQLQRQANETTAMENDGPAETADETIAVTHLDEPPCRNSVHLKYTLYR